MEPIPPASGVQAYIDAVERQLAYLSGPVRSAPSGNIFDQEMYNNPFVVPYIDPQNQARVAGHNNTSTGYTAENAVRDTYFDASLGEYADMLARFSEIFKSDNPKPTRSEPNFSVPDYFESDEEDY
jgi:hypothetical protein